EDAQRTEILRALHDQSLEALVVGLQRGHAPPPALEPLDRRGPLDGVAAQVTGLDLVVLDDRRDLHAGVPLAPRRDDDLEYGDVARDPRPLAEGEAGPPSHRG